MCPLMASIGLKCLCAASLWVCESRKVHARVRLRVCVCVCDGEREIEKERGGLGKRRRQNKEMHYV